MSRFLALFRGVNVSGQKKIIMTDLKKLFEGLGYSNVVTYIQSGNVVFESDASVDAADIQREVEKKYDFDIEVLVFEMDDMTSVITKNPFLKEKGFDNEKLHVTLLDNVPDSTLIGKLAKEEFGGDRYSIEGRAIYVYCPVGYGRTKLTNNFFERKLKVNATTRNWKTINELLKLMEE